MDALSLVDRQDLIGLTSELVSIPSVTNSEEEISDWLYDYFKDIGLVDIERFPVEDSGDTLAGWYPKVGDGPVLMLNFHMDTFKAFQGWDTDPFNPVIEGDRLYGLGAHDMKGGAACALTAVRCMIESGLDLGGGLLVTATSDEENWSRGAHALIEVGLLEGCDYCLVPEPQAPGVLTIGQRGRHVFHITFHGRAVSAAYDSGVNAVVDASRAVTELDELEELGYNEEFGMGGSLCVIGVNGGGTMILVPEVADVYIDRHILPEQGVDWAAEQIRRAIEGTGIEGKYELTWDERPTPAPGAFIVPPDSVFVKTVKKKLEEETGGDVELVLGRSVADTNHFAVHGGVPTLICGPTGGNTCEANEYVDTNSLPSTTRMLIKSITDLLQ